MQARVWLRTGAHPVAAGVAGNPVGGGLLAAAAQDAGVTRHILRVVILVVQEPLLQTWRTVAVMQPDETESCHAGAWSQRRPLL